MKPKNSLVREFLRTEIPVTRISVDKKLKHLFLALSILSLIILYLIFLFYSPQKIPLSQITEKNLDEKIQTEGIAEKISIYPSVTYLKLQNSNLSVVLFYPKEKSKIKINSSVEIIGKVSSYKGNLQIIAEKINCVDC